MSSTVGEKPLPRGRTTEPGASRWFDRPVVVVVVVVTVLVGLSFLNDPGGYLGTDTGGKTATLEAMVQRGDWSLDVGYWAEEHDPEGRYHPQYGTTRTDEGWVQVTSLPMVLAARPLYALGGYRAALLLPIAGTVLAALAAGALAGRLGDHRDRTRAYWIFALASPLTVYGLDLWEHSLGVAGLGWAAVALFDAVRDPGRWWLPVAGGAACAAAASMRTEALVYTLVLVGAACLALLGRGRLSDALRVGVLAVAGFVPVWFGNAALESALGGLSRTARATGAARAGGTGLGEPASASGGSELGARLEEGLQTTFSTAATGTVAPVVFGVVLVLAVASAARWGAELDEGRRRLVVVGLATLTLIVMLPGLGFVPGLFAAFPVAAAALASPWRDPQRLLVTAAALAALPVVWAFQFLGGAGPQWGGRYVLGSAFLLGVVGVVHLGRPTATPVIRNTVIAMSLAITVFGLAWLWQRSHEVDELFDQVIAVQEEALVARNKFFLREAGPASLDRKWLSAQDPADLEGPVDVLRDAGVETFSVLQIDGQPRPDFADAEELGADHVEALGVVFEVIHFAFDG